MTVCHVLFLDVGDLDTRLLSVICPLKGDFFIDGTCVMSTKFAHRTVHRVV